MRVIIAGSRDLNDIKYVEVAMRYFLKKEQVELKDIEVVSGAAKGIDSAAIQYAEENNLDLTVFYANWKRHGKSAGYKRNVRMGDYGDYLVAIRQNKSKGTTNMAEIMEDMNKPYLMVDVN